MRIEEAASLVRNSGLSLTKDADEVVEMVSAMADGLDDPEWGWFVADVLNEVNRMEMADEEKEVAA